MSSADKAESVCRGPNCAAARSNGHKHSNECRFEHARAVASGVQRVSWGVTVPNEAEFVTWRGHRIALVEPTNAPLSDN